MLDCRGFHGTGACVVFLLIQSRIICNLHGWPRTQYWMLYVGGDTVKSTGSEAHRLWEGGTKTMLLLFCLVMVMI